MKLYKFKDRGPTYDRLHYQLDVDYKPYEVNSIETIKLLSFKVYTAIDNDLYRFVVNGEYSNRKQEKVNEKFSLVIEEFKSSDFNSSFITTIFFNNRQQLLSLIQASFDGFVQVSQHEVVVKTAPKNIINQEYDDSFVEENVTREFEEEKDIVENPIIIFNAPIKGRPKGSVNGVVKPKPKKKPARRKPAVKKATPKQVEVLGDSNE